MLLNALKIKIGANINDPTELESIQNKMDFFLTWDRITEEEYLELMELINPPTE